jgi:hypothetical protein
MTRIIREPIAWPAAWKPTELPDPTRWTYRLNAAEVQEIEDALPHARAAAKPMIALTREDFPLPSLARTVRRWAAELDAGTGFVLVKGFPVDRLTPEDAGLAYYGLGLHLGFPVPQNAAGDLLGHVRDRGIPRTGPRVRLYTTRERQEFHTDGSDVVGLLCLRGAKSGGLSQIVSSAAIYNEILRRRSELVDLLYQPMYFDRNDEQPPGQLPYFALPICNVHQERLRTFYIGWYIRDAQRHADVPRLTPQQTELLDLIEQIANDPAFHLNMDFEPGDIQLLKNASILHSRTAYEDFDEPERKRHLLRLWLTAHDFSSVEGFLTQGIPGSS